MNSNSRYYHDDDCDPCGKEKKEKECKKEKKEECPTIIKCSCPSAVTIPVATAVNTTFTLASLTLNTGCICNPCAKIEFASNYVLTGFTGAISIQVRKQCFNQLNPVPVGPAFTFSRAVGVSDAGTFSFFICDCDSCFNDCCTYTAVATVTTATGAASVLALNNVTLGAIATCQTNACCC